MHSGAIYLQIYSIFLTTIVLHYFTIANYKLLIVHHVLIH